MASQPFVDIPFGPYLPDFGGMPNPENPAYLTDAINVRHTPNGYRGQPTFADVSGAATIGTSWTSANGASFTTLAAQHIFVVTSESNIYESRDEGDTWQEVSPASGSPYVVGDFVRFGDDVVYVSFTQIIIKDLTTSLATLFTALGGGAPTSANCGARIGQHLVVGGTNTDPYLVRTSAIGNHEDWPTAGTADARSKQSISESMNPEFGIVTKILSGEKFGIVCQKNALTRMTYVGGDEVYTFDTFERNLGIPEIAINPVTDGTFWYFYNETGMYVTDGYSVKSFSDGKIDESLFQNTTAHPDGGTIRLECQTVHDMRRGLLIVGKQTTSASINQLLYNVDTGTFSMSDDANQSALFLGRPFSIGTGTVHNNGVETYNVSSATRFLQKLTGATGTINMQTGFIELDPGYRFEFQGAHLLGVGAGALTLAYKTAATSSACDLVQTGFTSLTAAGLGEKDTGRASAQYIAFRITGTGAESQLIRGIRVYFRRAEPAP